MNFLRRLVVSDLADRFAREAVEGAERVRVLAAYGRADLGAIGDEFFMTTLRDVSRA